MVCALPLDLCLWSRGTELLPNLDAVYFATKDRYPVLGHKHRGTVGDNQDIASSDGNDGGGLMKWHFLHFPAGASAVPMHSDFEEIDAPFLP